VAELQQMTDPMMFIERTQDQYPGLDLDDVRQAFEEVKVEMERLRETSLNRPDMNVNILFIDEGFGTLDEKSLDSVMQTLEKLQEIAGQTNRRVGIISHREELEERIPVKIQVVKKGEGRSMIEVTNM
jgi:uncharacterized protein YqgV (UPF0045/DUF77 family)